MAEDALAIGDAARQITLRRPRLAAFLLVLATVTWALSFPLTKAITLAEEAALPGRSSWYYSSLALVVRFFASALLIFLWRPGVLRGITAREWKQAIGLGFFVAGGALFQNDALSYTSASTSAFLTQSYCVLLPIYAAVLLRAWPHPLVIISTLIVLAGITVLSGVNLRDLRLGRGEFETLLCSVFYAADIVWLERAEFRGNNVVRVTFVMFAVIGLLLLPFTAFQAHHLSDLVQACASAPVLGCLAVLTLFCTLLSFTIMNMWQPHIEAAHAGLIYCAEPVFASLLALFLPAWLSLWCGVAYGNEIASAHLVLGGGLITLANVLILFKPAPLPARSTDL
jgi:drug/metabolite transporter (DMT)-like permease